MTILSRQPYVVMPGMDGLELIERLTPWRREMSLLVMSGHAEARHRQDERTLGLDIPYLQKPFSPEELRAKVREVLEAIATRHKTKTADTAR